MRKIILFFFVFQSLIFNGFGQTAQKASRIFISEKNVSVGELMSEITKQSGADFSYNSKDFNTKKRIDFSAQAATIRETLKIFCEKIDADFELIEGQIILFARKYYNLTGFVTDRKTGETLIGATVAVKGTSRGVFTNAFGFYSLEMPAGKNQIECSYLGFQPEEFEINLKANQKNDFSIESSSVDLPKVIVGIPMRNLLDRKDPGKPEIAPSFLSSMPEFAGESGLVKGLQSLPGIKTHSDGSAFFFVRGGERDQNLIIIDDAPIFNPSHMFGFYSLVIPDFAKSIKVYKSNVPANLGDRLSSVIDIRTRDGNQNRFQLGGALNPFINRLSLESPILWKRGSFFASARLSNFQQYLNRSNPNIKLSFGDFILKFNYKINSKNRVFYTGLFSGDNLSDSGGTGLSWGNAASTFRWNHIFGSKFFLNSTIHTGVYNYQLSLGTNTWRSALGSLSLKSEFTHYIHSDLTSKFGFEWQAYGFEPGKINVDSSLVDFFPKITSNASGKSAFFYQTDWNISEKFTVSAGIRYLKWSNRGPTTYYEFDDAFEVADTVEVGVESFQKFRRLDPRLNLRYELNKTSRVSVGIGRYHQFLQMISNSNAPFSSFEIWLPPSPTILPQSAVQLDFNFLKYFEKQGLEFSSSIYLKRLNRQIEYSPHSTILLNPLVEGELRFGSGRAYGAEFFIKKDIGRLTGRLGYDYSRVSRSFSDINSGNSFNAFQDRPHDFSLMLNYKLKRRILISGYWTSSTGSPFSAPTGFYNFQDQTIPVFGEKHNARLPDYHRLDLALKFILNKKEDAKYRHSLTFSIYNALAHPNVYSAKFNKIPKSGTQSVELKTNLLNEEALIATQIDLIRFMPSLTYKFKI